jgi:hypothetical protein
LGSKRRSVQATLSAGSAISFSSLEPRFCSAVQIVHLIVITPFFHLSQHCTYRSIAYLRSIQLGLKPTQGDCFPKFRLVPWHPCLTHPIHATLKLGKST